MAKRRKEKIDEKDFDKGIEISNAHKKKMEKQRNERLNVEEDEPEINIVRKIIRFIIIVAIIVGIIIFYNYGPILGIKFFDVSNEPIVIDNLLSNETTYLEYNSELLVYTSGVIYTYDKNGNNSWKYELIEGFVPTIYTKDKYMVVANKNNGMLYFFNNKREAANRIIDGKIENVYINGDGSFIIQYIKDIGYKKVIALYDEKGNLKYEEQHINSSPIIGIEFLKNDNKVLIIQADSSNINIGTTFNLLDFETGEYKEIKKYSDKLVYSYKLLNNEIIFTSDKAVEIFNIDTGMSEEIHKLSESQMNYIYLSNNYFVTIETVKNGSKVTTIKFDDKEISNIEINTYPKYIYTSGLLTYVVSENVINVINKWGVEVSNIKISLAPKKIVVFNQEKTVALIYSNKVEIMNI